MGTGMVEWWMQTWGTQVLSLFSFILFLLHRESIVISFKWQRVLTSGVAFR